MRCKGSIAALLAAALVAAAPLRAQQQDAPREPSLPERVIEGIGSAIRDSFQGIFGQREGEIRSPQQPSPPAAQPPAPPAQPQAQQPGQPPTRQQEPQRQEQAKSEPAVAATPSAQAAPQSLHAAIAKGDYASALKMIDGGTDIEAKDPGAGASALHYAVMKGTMPMIGLLLQRGAEINSRTRSGTTPLHTAVLYGHIEVAEYLVEKGADINAKSASGTTPLSIATAANYPRIIKMLRRHGAN